MQNKNIYLTFYINNIKLNEKKAKCDIFCKRFIQYVHISYQKKVPILFYWLCKLVDVNIF